MFVLLLACQSIPTEKESFTEQIDGSTAGEFDTGTNWEGTPQVISTVSQDGFHIVARYVNEYQATIPGVRDISLELYDSQSVAFPFLQLDLQTDAWGYAEKTLTAEELFAEEPFYGTIVAKIVGDTSTVTDTGDSSGSFDHGGTKLYYAPPPFETLLSSTHYLDSQIQSPSKILKGYNEYLVVKGKNVYIKGRSVLDGYYPILELPKVVKGISTFHIDNDGIDDVVVWDSNHIFLLRGRENGGLTWGSAFQLSEAEITAVSISDVNSDGKSDITVAFNKDDNGVISVLEGSGNWTFEEQEAFILPYEVQSMISIDEDQDGVPDISLIRSDNQKLERFTKSDLGWINIDNSAANAFDANDKAFIAPMQDLNADGRKDLIIIDGVEETQASSSQSIVFITIAEILTKYEMNFDNPVEVLFADLHDDDSINILTMDKDAFKVIGLNEQGSFVSRRVAGFGEKAPFLVEDQNNDGINDLLFAGVHYSRYLGQNAEEDDWRIAKPIFATNTVDADQGILIGNFNGDDNIEVVQFASDSNGLRIKSSQYVLQDDILQLKNYNATQISPNTEVLDYANCGNSYFGALVRDASGEGSDLMVFQMNDDFSFEIQSTTIANSPDKIYCKAKGDTADFAVMRSGYTIESVRLFTHTLNEYPVNQLDLPDDLTIVWNDIALGYASENTEQLNIRGCTDVGCDIEMADLNADGIDEIVERDRDKSVTITSGEYVWSAEQSGDIAIRDLNGDGLQELLIYESSSTDEISQYMWVVPILDNDISRVFGFRTLSSFTGVPFFEDINFDGENDVILPVSGTELSYSVEVR